MRVLILSNLYPNPWQPHRATFNRQQFAALARLHEVRIIAPVAWTDQLSSQHRRPHERTLLRDGIHVEHPRYVFPPKVLRSWHGHFYLRSIRPTFNRALAQFRPDVVLASWAYPDVWAAVELGREANLPVVAKVHGSDVLMLNQYRARQQRTAEALKRADAVIAVSRQLAASVGELGVSPDRIHVVYNGIDTTLFHPGKATIGIGDEPMLLFIGNLVPVKGLETLIDACGHLRDRGVAFQCRMIGQGPLQQSLSRRIDSANLTHRVKLPGPIALEQLPDWYRAAALFVLPSRSEGVPNVILEALACGTPVVASRVGSIPEILDEKSMVPPGDAVALADAIARVLSGEQTHSLSKCRPQSWKTSATQLSNVLVEVVRRSRKAAA